MNGGRGIHLALGFHSFVVPGATKHDLARLRCPLLLLEADIECVSAGGSLGDTDPQNKAPADLRGKALLRVFRG
jgi:hypothetical protein